MNTARASVAGVVAVIAACGVLQVLHDHRFVVNAGDNLEPVHQMEWPRGSGEYATVNNSIVDPAGLAGLLAHRQAGRLGRDRVST